MANDGPQTLTLTNGTDFIKSGSLYGDPILGPVTVADNHVTILAPNGTLNGGDDIELKAGNNAIFSAYAPGIFNFHSEGPFTILGVQSATFSNKSFSSTVQLFGGPQFFGPSTGGVAPGLRTLTFAKSIGSMILGAPGAFPNNGVESVIQTLNLSNDAGIDPFFSVFVDSAVMTPGARLQINVSNAIDTSGGDYTVDVGPGSTGGGGGNGYAHFVLNLQDTATHRIALGALGSGSATSLRLEGNSSSGAPVFLDASNHLASGSGDWFGLLSLTSIMAGGNVNISGGMFSFDPSASGFLSSLTTGPFTLTMAGGNNSVDLTAFTSSASTLSVSMGSGGSNELDIQNSLANTTVNFVMFSGVTTLGVSDQGGIGGTYDLVHFPGIQSIKLYDSDGDGNADLGSNLTIIDQTAPLTLNVQNLDFAGNNIGVASNNPNNSFTLKWGDVSNSDGSFLGFNESTVTLEHTTSSGHAMFETHFTVQNGGAAPTLNIQMDAFPGTLWLASDAMFLGGDASALAVGTDTVTLTGQAGPFANITDGAINITGFGKVAFGVTNALTITGTSSTGPIVMLGPDDMFNYNGVVGSGVNVNVVGAENIIQGTLGPLAGSQYVANSTWSGVTGNDALTSTGGDSFVFGIGGADNITLGQVNDTGAGEGNNVFFGSFDTGFGLKHGITITDTSDKAYTGFWGVGSPGVLGAPTAIASSTEADMSTINNFTVGGSNHDTLTFNGHAWADGVAGAGGLVNASGVDVAGAGVSTMQRVTAPGAQLNSGTNFVLYDMGTINSAADLATALASGGIGDVKTFNALTNGEHMLFAYVTGTGHLHIADVDFVTASGVTDTAGATIAVSDMADLGTGISLITLGINNSDVVYANHSH